MPSFLSRIRRELLHLTKNASTGRRRRQAVVRPTISAEQLEFRELLSAIALVVEDAIPGGGLNNLTGDSNPASVMSVSGTTYFSANDGVNGTELWRLNSSGVAEMIEDAVPGGGIFPGIDGSDPKNLTDVSGTLYFWANDGTNGTELWRLNNSGKAEMVEDSVPGGGINPGSGSSFPTVSQFLTNVNGTLYFSATDGTNGGEIWRINSSGVAEMVEDSVPGGGIRAGAGSPLVAFTAVVTAVNDTLYLSLNDGINGSELWRVNNAGGAALVEDAVPGGGIRPGSGNSYPESLTNLNGTLYFTASDGTNGRELWRIDSAGTAVTVEDTVAGGGIRPSGGSYPGPLTNVSGTLYFGANDGTNGNELWRVNSSGVAEMIEDAIPGGGIQPGAGNASPREFANVNGTLYFFAKDGTSHYDLWRMNSASIAERVSVAGTGEGIKGAFGFSTPTTVNGTLYFVANNGTNDYELWRVNASGDAEIVEDAVAGGGINPGTGGSAPQGLTNVNGVLYFLAIDGTNGREVWRVNSAGIAEMVDDAVPGPGIAPGSSDPAAVSSLMFANGVLYFTANNGTSGAELWRINSAGIAEIVEDAIPGGGINRRSESSAPDFLTNLNGVLYFRATDSINGLELWRINSVGVAEMVEDAIPGGGIGRGAESGVSGATSELTAVNNTLYFVGNDGVNGSELWRINSSGIAEMVEDAIPGGGIATGIGSFANARPSNLINVSGTLYFEASDEATGRELWRINSAGIAEMVEDAVPGNGIRPGTDTFGEVLRNATNVNGTLYFRMQPNLGSPAELWRVNSSGIAEAVPLSIPSGTYFPAGAGKNPTRLTGSGGTLFFVANDGTSNDELWRVSNSGVAEVVDDGVPGIGIRPGTNPANVLYLTDVSGTLYFSANDGVNGAELWRAGSSGLAEMVEDAVPGGGINPGSGSSSPQHLSNLNGTLYFSAFDGTNGGVWRINSSGLAEIAEDGGISAGFGGGVVVNGATYYVADDAANGTELWRLNSNGSTEMVEDLIPGGGLNPGAGSANPQSLINFNGTLYFAASDGSNGDFGNNRQMWRINGAGIAEQVAFVVPGETVNPASFVPDPRYLTIVNDTLFFYANGGSSTGVELWMIQINAAPTSLSLSALSVPEDAPSGATVGTFSTTDPNAGNFFSYSLVSGTGATDNARFTMVGDTLTTATAFNFEAKSSYTVRVRTTDQEGLSFEKVFVISVTNVNESPTSLTLAGSVVAENSPAGTTVGSFSTTDPDASNTFSYALVSGTGSTDNAGFTINGNTLKTAASFNFETKSSYSIRVKTTDQGGLSFERVFTITVTNVAEAPTALALSASTIPEDVVPGTAVGTFTSTDPDTGSSFTYVLVSGAGGTDNASFSIVGNALKTGSPLNFETKSGYSIRVRTTDQSGLSFEQVFPISVTNVNETPTALTLSRNTIAENMPLNSTVGTFTTSDPDIANTFTYTLVSGAGSTDNSSFAISGNSIRTAAALNFEAKSSYSVRVRTTDQGGMSFEQTFTITVTNVNEPPATLTLSSTSIAENMPAEVTVGTFSSTDPDGAGVLTYALVPGVGSTDNSAFSISGNALKTTAAFNFELKKSYSVRVRTTDQSGQFLEKSFLIAVTNVNESPTGLTLSKTAIAENLPSGSSVGTFSTIDPDASSTFTYSLIAGSGSTDNARFTIDGNTLKTTASFNFEAKSSYSIRVRTTDQGGLSFDKVFAITVTDVNDAPVIAAFDAPVTYTENGLPTVLDLNAIVTDADSLNLATGRLTAIVSANAQPTDRIGIKNIGNAAGQIGVAGNSVSYGGVAIGTFSGTTTFVVTLNTSATPAAVQALLRSLTFSIVSDTPSTLDRTVKITLTDGDGGTANSPMKTVRVIAMNDAPVIAAFDTPVTYTENGLPTVLDLNATVTDADSLNLATGRLTAIVSANAQSTDRIGIKHIGNAAGQIGVSGSTVSYGGVAIGTFSGTTTFVVTLNTSATPAAVQALLRSLTFFTMSDLPSTLDRTVKITLTDGDGGTSSSPTKTVRVIAVNDSPVIAAFDTSVTYTENGLPTVLDLNATVADVDSLNLATGKLTAIVSANAQSTDRIGIKHTGNAAGQIGVAGSTVSYGGVAIGTFSGTTTFVVTLNTSATPAAVQALLRSLTFSTVSDTPSTLDRTVKITLTDGDGGTSNSPTKTVRVIAVNDAPVIAEFDAPVTYRAGGTGTILDSNATVVDTDSVNSDLGKLTFRITANVQSTDVLQIRHQGTATGQVGVNGSDVLYGGIAIGKITGGIGSSPLVVTFNSAATSAAVQAVIRNVTFRNTSAAPGTLPRTVSVSLSDGDGGISAVQLKQIEIIL